MKKHFHFLLMAALVCSLCLSVTSCKSDDDSSNNGNGGEEQETYEGLSTLENDQLADLVAAWTDASRDDLNGTEWLISCRQHRRRGGQYCRQHAGLAGH